MRFKRKVRVCVSDVIQIQTIGELIHQYRRESGMTLSQLSDITGSHKGTISRIENGDVKRPEFETVHPLASALGIPFEDIVERYIEIDKRADSLQTILQTVIQSGNIELINKVALKFLESPSEDSYILVERLYTLADAIEDKPIRLSLYRLLIHYSRNHGMMLFLAKGLYAAYLIERDDFTKLKATYDSGKHIIHYVNFLSKEERISLYYKLGVHAFNLRLFEDSIELCNTVLEEDPSDSLFKVNSTGILRDSHYYLGNYDLSEKYSVQYSKFNHPHVKENVLLLEAALHAKKGDVLLAISQLQLALNTCGENSQLHVINQLLTLYLDQGNLSAIHKLLEMEERVVSVPYSTPYKQSRLAQFFKLKGDFYVAGGDFEKGITSYLESAHQYTIVNDTLKERECMNCIINLHIRDNKVMSIDILNKLSKYYNRSVSHDT